MVQNRATVTTADEYKVVYDLFISTIFSDLERPLTQISRSSQYLTLNMTSTIQDRHVFTPTMDN